MSPEKKKNNPTSHASRCASFNCMSLSRLLRIRISTFASSSRTISEEPSILALTAVIEAMTASRALSTALVALSRTSRFNDSSLWRKGTQRPPLEVMLFPQSEQRRAPSESGHWTVSPQSCKMVGMARESDGAESTLKPVRSTPTKSETPNRNRHNKDETPK